MIIFRNSGTLDVRAIKTFGLSSKSGQDKIGRFGTGLKYATAVIARHGGKMTIATGGETYAIASKPDEFRGQAIAQLTMNGEDLPYTSDLGRDWEPWMAFRELYANALDEGGDVSRGETMPEQCGDETVIGVDLAAFEAIFWSMEEHFVGREESPIWKSASIAVYPGRSLFIFYRGIAVMKLKEPAALRYNLLNYVDLTEDRTAKYDWQVRARIADALASCDDEKILHAAVDQRNTFEATIDFSSATPSDAFIGAAVAVGVNCNPTAMALVKAKMPADRMMTTVLSREQPGGAALHDALRLLAACGADLSKATFVLAEGVAIYGDYNVKGRAVFLNEAVFDKPARMAVAVFEGYAETVGDGWLAKALIETAKAKAD